MNASTFTPNELNAIIAGQLFPDTAERTLAAIKLLMEESEKARETVETNNAAAFEYYDGGILMAKSASNTSTELTSQSPRIQIVDNCIDSAKTHIKSASQANVRLNACMETIKRLLASME